MDTSPPQFLNNMAEPPCCLRCFCKVSHDWLTARCLCFCLCHRCSHCDIRDGPLFVWEVGGGWAIFWDMKLNFFWWAIVCASPVQDLDSRKLLPVFFFFFPVAPLHVLFQQFFKKIDQPLKKKKLCPLPKGWFTLWHKHKHKHKKNMCEPGLHKHKHKDGYCAGAVHLSGIKDGV